MNREAERKRLVGLISKADDECKHTKSCKNCSGYGKGSLCMNYHIADHLLDNGIVVLPKGIEEQKIHIANHEHLVDEIAKDLFKIDEEYTGGAKVWVRTDVYKKLMKILALSNHLVKVLRILLTREQAEKALEGNGE